MNPPPIAGVAPHTVDLVVADLQQRKEMGAKKYGVAHQSDNGRNHAVDLYEELMDACVYLRANLDAVEAARSQGYRAGVEAAAKLLETAPYDRLPEQVRALVDSSGLSKVKP